MKGANSFGQLFQVTTFGESHGVGLGAVIDGCPAGVDFDFDFLEESVSRRRPGNFGGKSGHLVSQRKEEDKVEVLSGVFQGRTLGTPIAMLVRNKDQRSKDYEEIALKPRKGHADDVWKQKFGHVDPRGGGRSSGRETVARVMAGAVAEMFLSQTSSMKVVGFASQIGPFKLSSPPKQDLDRKKVDASVARFPDSQKGSDIERLLLEAKKEGLSYGGKVGIFIKGVPAGLGQPVFHKLKADLAAAFLSVGATSACELGLGFDSSEAEGTQFHQREDVYGGVRGGLSTGEDIYFNLSFKPTSSVLDVAKKGRHDPCIVIRAVPVIEAMTALVLADHVLWRRLDRLEQK